MAATTDTAPLKWTTGLTKYHYLVLTVAACGWLFDTMDQWLYVLARGPALKDLLSESLVGLSPDEAAAAVKEASGHVQAIFLFGWATGGLFFGMIGDRLGRTRTMAITVFIYAVFTGLSGFAQNYYDFAAYRFLTGLGIGGEFAAGAALIAEVFPAHARAKALGIMQACSALGNMMAGVIGLLVAINVEGEDRWRYMFLIGLAPALLIFVIRAFVHEPEQWTEAKAKAARGEVELGSVKQMFTVDWLRRRVLVGIALAAIGVIGFWGIGTFTPDLLRESLLPKGDPTAIAANVTEWADYGIISEEKRDAIIAEESEVAKPARGQVLEQWASVGVIVQNFGSFFGMLAFAFLAERFGRRPTFAVAFLACLVVVPLTFHLTTQWWHIFIMFPLLGLFTSLLFGGYAVYFPELFPTRLRATGTGFCYNVARYIAILAPSLFGSLSAKFGFANAATIMSAVFVLGLVILPFAPETKGKPLPE